MKSLPQLLAFSVALNVALATAFVLRPSLASPKFRELFSRRSAPEFARASGKSAVPTPAAMAEDQIWAAIRSDDLPTLIRHLRDAGFPPAMARAVVTAAVDAAFTPRFDSLIAPLEHVPYWKPDPVSPLSWNTSGLGDTNNQLYRERTKALREALDANGLTPEPTAEQRRSYGDLSPLALERIRRINDDYAAMTSQISAAMLGVALPEDREKFALLEREKRADLAAAVTPAELAEYDRHTSPVLSSLRSTLTVMNATEEEFETIFRLRFAVDQQLKLAGSASSDRTDADRRSALALQLSQDLRAALGDERYADYARANTNEFQQLTRLAQRENLPAGLTIQAFSLRDAVAQESSRIVGDATLTVEQQRAALQSLAQDTRTRIQALLGATTGPAYVNLANRWLVPVEQGNAVTFDLNGIPAYQRLSPPPAATTAARN